MYEKMSSRDYDHYKEMIQIYVAQKDKDALKALYAEIQKNYGYCEELREFERKYY